jgi:hypothetical protein
VRVQRLTERVDDGAVAVFVALLLTLFMVLAAFALDIGNAYAKVRQQSVAADAAALAAAAKVGDAVPAGTTTCTPTLLTSIGATSIAQTAADAMNNSNSKSGGEPATTVAVSCQDSGKAIQVRVDNHHPVPTALAGIIGISSINSNSYAVARWVKVSSTTGLRPWAVCDGQVSLSQQQPDVTFATGLDNKVGICSTQSNGNWGSIDFNGGSNPAGDLADWTRDGYPDPVTIPGTLPADPGVTNSQDLRDAFISLINQQVLFPSVSGYNGGSGNNGSFAAVGVATVKVCGVRYGGVNYNTEADGTASDCWVDPNGTSTTTSVDTDITRTGTIVTSGSGNNKKTVLTLTTAGFDSTVDPTTVTVTIPGAKKQGNKFVDLVTNLVSYDTTTPTTKAVLGTVADKDVAGASVRIQWSVTTTTVTPGIVPLDTNKKPIDHIQFRWISFTTSWTGTGTATCTWNDGRCVGAVGLWQ